ncbi:hypothetical protein ASG52_09470 [Methylobacterium sp. Leaf456]|uniref:hypothetical protein n=1 Tax=Methylobacterium sp. Leaf456 TaxID=1736382 RepID=UPI00070193C2|nr:hypothetical protein [Methylobacterium sp. Leaf456]KQT49188.1 hypothetical protein ASG52_09470 [Methylobacterium sp. Leaf456]
MGDVRHLSGSYLVAFAAFLAFMPIRAAQALDGPYKVSQGFYKFLDRSDPLVASDRKIDYWAQVYRPTTLTGKPFPLIIFLHGNHSTCGRYDDSAEVRFDDRSNYTTTGKCPSGYTVAPNHLGYTYLAEELASWGYVVVSINANRGITGGIGVDGDSGLNLMRGRLVLRHMALLSAWNRGTGQFPPPVTLGFNPFGTMDFDQVGMMGHSRGGEGVRAALQQLRDAGSPFPKLIGQTDIRSLFEIGPVDGQTSRVLNADGVNSMILLPSCDGDVWKLDGMKVFDRVFLSKTIDASKTFHETAHVWGANHNAYNTEWQTSNSLRCFGSDTLFQSVGSSKPQQLTALQTLAPFFRATVGAKVDLKLAQLFSPANPLPDRLIDITNVDRGYLPRPIGSDVIKLETFSQDTGKTDSGLATRAYGVRVTHQSAAQEHQSGTRVAAVEWESTTGGGRYFRIPFKDVKNFSNATALSFRTALGCFGSICDFPASPDGEAAYGVILLDANGQATNFVSTQQFVRLSRPVGGKRLHRTLYTVQIPLTAFRGIDLSRVTAIQFNFPQLKGTVNIADVTLLKSDPLISTTATSVASLKGKRMGMAPVARMAEAVVTAAEDANTIRVVRDPAASLRRSARPAAEPDVDIVLTSKRSFPVTNAFPELTVGDSTLQGGDISADGKTMTVTVPASTFDRLKPGANVSLSVVASSPVWQFGRLPK